MAITCSLKSICYKAAPARAPPRWRRGVAGHKVRARLVAPMRSFRREARLGASARLGQPWAKQSTAKDSPAHTRARLEQRPSGAAAPLLLISAEGPYTPWRRCRMLAGRGCLSGKQKLSGRRSLCASLSPRLTMAYRKPIHRRQSGGPVGPRGVSPWTSIQLHRRPVYAANSAGQWPLRPVRAWLGRAGSRLGRVAWRSVRKYAVWLERGTDCRRQGSSSSIRDTHQLLVFQANR